MIWFALSLLVFLCFFKLWMMIPLGFAVLINALLGIQSTVQDRKKKALCRRAIYISSALAIVAIILLFIFI